MRRIAALDGLRGLAILLVVIYHARRDWMPGGAIGVTLFFVLSGFLITRILTRHDRIDYKRFYTRRALRLLPAVVLFLIGVWAITGRVVWHPLTYTANFAAIYDWGIQPAGHTWSLSVEEHFYLVWPLVVSVIPRQHLKTGVAVLFGMAVTWRLSMIGADYYRVAFGTDTSAYALLAGCALAVWKPRPIRPVFGWAAVVGIGTVAAFGVALTDGFLYLEIAGALLAVVAVHVASTRRIPVLEWDWLVWLGAISYSLYLWHALFLYVLPAWVAVALAVLVAWLSWQAVEQPLLRLGDSPRKKTHDTDVAVVANHEPNLDGSTGKERSAAD